MATSEGSNAGRSQWYSDEAQRYAETTSQDVSEQLPTAYTVTRHDGIRPVAKADADADADADQPESTDGTTSVPFLTEDAGTAGDAPTATDAGAGETAADEPDEPDEPDATALPPGATRVDLRPPRATRQDNRLPKAAEPEQQDDAPPRPDGQATRTDLPLPKPGKADESAQSTQTAAADPDPTVVDDPVTPEPVPVPEARTQALPPSANRLPKPAVPQDKTQQQPMVPQDETRQQPMVPQDRTQLQPMVPQDRTLQQPVVPRDETQQQPAVQSALPPAAQPAVQPEAPQQPQQWWAAQPQQDFPTSVPPAGEQKHWWERQARVEWPPPQSAGGQGQPGQRPGLGSTGIWHPKHMAVGAFVAVYGVAATLNALLRWSDHRADLADLLARTVGGAGAAGGLLVGVHLVEALLTVAVIAGVRRRRYVWFLPALLGWIAGFGVFVLLDLWATDWSRLLEHVIYLAGFTGLLFLSYALGVRARSFAASRGGGVAPQLSRTQEVALAALNTWRPGPPGK